jgi:hypothetical protein
MLKEVVPAELIGQHGYDDKVGDSNVIIRSNPPCVLSKLNCSDAISSSSVVLEDAESDDIDMLFSVFPGF